ncbi:MAG TPA: phenylalanine--tRNA ligase subunit beta [Sphingomonas sp.]|jgi:phenylalanyl-tRNA synthetase beta chain|nr:phenylalanine--tRNA ligase subunit beta [Sphingomonas sp.]
MKFTLGWLKEHLVSDATAQDVADTLNKIGLEVEGVDDPADRFTGFTVARVLTADRHPQADKLQVLTVDAGNGPLQIVCGAPNARAGLVGVLGSPGATVPANGMVLKVAAVRGVESHGMMCSSRELGLGDEHDGIIELPEDAPVGTAYADYAGSDPVFDVAITPNRQDCMGVRGIARDLAAAGLGTVKPLAQVYYADDLNAVEGSEPAPEIRIDDPEGCPAFYGQAISGVTNGAAPAWMTKKLAAVGQKSISALVDMTNFLTLDLGRPLHVYDRAKLSGPLNARKARDGETVETLNGKTYTLDASMTVIADDAGVHDIGGIMGGMHSGVSDTTTDVIIECAYFTPETIALTGQKLGLTSDARARFERGVDPAFLDEGLSIATRFVLEHCGGTASAVTRVGQPPVERKVVPFDPALTAKLGGVELPADEQVAILTRLGFEVDGGNASVPTWRRDVDGPADLVEEVVRIAGLHRVTSVALPRPDGVAKPTATASQKREGRVRRAAAARGLNEAVTWSFVSESDAASFGGAAWTLANPISEELKAMRPSLLPGLLSAARRNLQRDETSVRLFEVGRRYLADAERTTVGVVLAGDKSARGWASGKAQAFDAYDAKGEALALLSAAGAPVDNLQIFGEAGHHFHPGQSATLRLGPKTVLASFGMLHPATAKAFDLDGPVAAAEIYLDAIPAARGGSRPAYTPSALQAVRRDFAFLVPADVAADALVRAVKGADKAAINSARVFDRFAGAGVPEGQVSLAVEVTLQPSEQSFTEADLKAIAERILTAATKLGAVLRG